MAFLNSEASSSKHQLKQASSAKDGRKPRSKRPSGERVKSNQARRIRADDELKELQTRVDGYVGVESKLRPP